MLSVSVLGAQDTGGEAVTVAAETTRATGANDFVTAEQANTLLDSGVNNAVAGLAASPFVWLIVQALKPLIAAAIATLPTGRARAYLVSRTATDYALAVSLLLVVGGSLADSIGYSGTFDSSSQFLGNLLPLMVSVMSAVGFSAVWYNGANRLGAGGSVLGRSLTPTPPTS